MSQSPVLLEALPSQVGKLTTCINCKWSQKLLVTVFLKSHRFFRHYASFLPILDAQTKPNGYYAQSPFLFWAVIGVASRSYSRNPTLHTALAQEVTEMAFLSVLSTCAPWYIIQGLLLLLTWPFPKENRPDVTFPLSGMLLHVAMQNGFHIPMSSHEFSRVKIPASSDLDMVRRSELWAHCVLVYQRWVSFFQSVAKRTYRADSF